MSTEPKLLVSLINAKDLSYFLKIDKNIFKSESGKEGYEFINSYYSEYKELPPDSIFKEKFPEMQFSSEVTNPDFHYKELCKLEARNQLARALQEASVSFNTKEDTATIASKIVKTVGNLSNLSNTEKVVDIRQNAQERYDKVLTKMSNEKKEKLFTLGHPFLDKLGDVENSSLNLILGRYGTGKSWLGLYLAYKYWKKGLNPLFVSIEMPLFQVEERLDSIISGVSYSRMKEGSLYQEELEHFKRYIKDMGENTNQSNLNVVAPSRCNVQKIREMAKMHNAGVVIVDYIQLMQDVNKAKEKRIALGNIANDSKAIAKELEIPIFYIAQANRTAVDEVPRGEHVKDCDEISAASDLILSLYQDKTLKEQKKMELHITKYRSGEEGMVTVDWEFNFMNFMDVKNGFFVEE